MRCTFIAAQKAEHTVSILCRCLRVTRSGFYAWQRRPESTHACDDRRLTVLVRASFAESKQRYGSPRIHEDLREQHEHVSRTRVIRLMQQDGRQARARKRYKLTTMSDHDQPAAANLLDRQFAAEAPDQRWVGDTTEFVVGSSGKLYLAAVLDLFSRFVVGWAVSAANDRHVTIKALEMALKRRCLEIGLLHHSDQGCTYASADYQSLLDARGIVCSMSRRGNCYDNAVMESFFSTVKAELAGRFDSCGEAKMELFDYIEVFYNQRRRHSTIGQISPAAYERRAHEEGMDAMENRTERGFPQRPHPPGFLWKRRTKNNSDDVVNLSTESDQVQPPMTRRRGRSL
jgi:transposase InsO family protein